LRPTAAEHVPSIHPAPHEAWRRRPPPRIGRRRALAGAVGLSLIALAGAVAHVRPHASRTLPAVWVSGAPGVRTTPSGAHERWAVAAPVTIVLDGSLDAETKEAVRLSLGSWIASVPGLPPVTVDGRTDKGRAAQDGVNRILRGPIKIPGHEHDVAATITYAEDHTGAIVEADVILNSEYEFGVLDGAGDDKTSCAGRYDVQNVVTHEAGHFFGLGEELTDQNATMYVRSLPCQTHKRALTPLDTTALGALYPESAAGGAGLAGAASGDGAEVAAAARCEIANPPKHDTRSRSTSMIFGLALALGLAAARRRRQSSSGGKTVSFAHGSGPASG